MIYSKANFFVLFTVLLGLFSCDRKLKETTKNTISTESYDFKHLIGKDYLIDDQHSYLGFNIKYFGYSPVRGRFNEFDGTLFYDTTNLASISTTIFIDINSINTGNERRDDDLKKEGTWFDATTYPHAIFRSRQVVEFENEGFELLGDLTIKDSTKSVTFNFEKPTRISRDWAKNEQVDFTGKAIINRQDFGVYGGDFWSSIMEDGLTQLSDEVELELNIHCRRPDYQARYEDMDSTDTRKLILNEIKENGIERGKAMIVSFYNQKEVSMSGLSTIGYVLNAWKMHKEAIEIFSLKMDVGEENKTVLNQLGATYLLHDEATLSESAFIESLEVDSVNSRAVEYLRLINSRLK